MGDLTKPANDTIADGIAAAVLKSDVGGRSFAIFTPEIAGRRYVVMPLDTYREDVERPKRKAREAADEIAALRARVAELEGHLGGVIDHFVDRGEGSQGPGHCHDTPGIWDADNAPGIAGERCEWCAKWNAARAALSRPNDGGERG